MNRIIYLLLVLLLPCPANSQADSARQPASQKLLREEQIRKKLEFEHSTLTTDQLNNAQLGEVLLKSKPEAEVPLMYKSAVKAKQTSDAVFMAAAKQINTLYPDEQLEPVSTSSITIPHATPARSVQTSEQTAVSEAIVNVARTINPDNTEQPPALPLSPVDPPVVKGKKPLAKTERLRGPSDYDSRIELRLLNPLIDWQSRMLQNSRSVGLVVRRANLTAITDSLYRLNTTLTLGQRYRLCTGQPFADQPVAGEGTAFLISSNECLTAGHVLTGAPEHYALVFGFELASVGGSYLMNIPAKNIYYFTGITGGNQSLDVLKVRLNRAATADRPPLPLATAGTEKPGTEIYMLGYPSGLPQKAAVNARIKQSDDHTCFYSTLDAFAGNSGSPVFDKNTHRVIGILVSGAADFNWNGSCNVLSMCQPPFCMGEKAIKISALLLITTP